VSQLAMATPRPATVLHLDNSYSFGGAIISLAHMVGSLDLDRYRAVVVSGQPGDYLESLFPSAETRVLDQKLPWRDNELYRSLTSWSSLRSGAPRRIVDRVRAAYWLVAHEVPAGVRYGCVARRIDADVIHLNNNVESQPSGILAARLAGLPCVAHCRSFQRPLPSLRWYASLVDHHVAISTAVRQDLVELGVPEERISVVHDAVNVEEIRSEADRSAPREEFGIGEGEFLFGLVGRVVPWKGTIEFVEAAIQVLEREPRARAFVIGDASDGDPEYFDAVRALVRKSGLSKRIVLTGYREDVPALMKAMDLVVHASTVPEPFGMVLIEAMAVGTPVVATQGGGPEDIVEDGRSGLLVAPGSPAAIRDAVLELLNDPGRRAEMGRSGMERVAEHFSSLRYASQMMEIYDRLLNRENGESRETGTGGSSVMISR